MRTQLNVRIEKGLAKRVSGDKRGRFATNDIIVAVALENWFSKFTPEQRDKFYKAHFQKPYEQAA